MIFKKKPLYLSGFFYLGNMAKNILQYYFDCNQKVCTDTRKLTENCLFICLTGENFNGNKFAKQAIDQGAKYAVIDQMEYEIKGKTILVNDCLKTLQSLAHEYRLSLDIPVIGITGSNGKTTSKELIGNVLSKKYLIHVTPGNFNNHIGLPLTILTAPKTSEILLLEMGDNHPGEINELCEIAHPTHGLITNVGKDHIEGFGSFEKNKLAKKELYDYVEKTEGEIFLPMFEDEVVEMATSNHRMVKIGGELKELSSNPFVQYKTPEEQIIKTNFIGDYNFKNIQMAYSIGVYFDVNPDDIHAAIKSYQPQNNRSQFIETGRNQLFLDAYNANPSSVLLALESFEKQNLSANRIAILGDMLELGDVSDEEHQAVINMIKKMDVIGYFVGQEYCKNKSESSHLFFKDRLELIEYLQSNPISNAQILIKGSRGIRLEETVPFL